MQPDYFEVLPIHPRPQPMETLTSYLTRLAEANGIPNICRLQPIIFPDRERRLSARHEGPFSPIV